MTTVGQAANGVVHPSLPHNVTTSGTEHTDAEIWDSSFHPHTLPFPGAYQKIRVRS